MNMVGHQDVSVDRDAVQPGSNSEAIEIEPVIRGAREHLRTVVSALDNVQHGAGEEESRLARHAPSCSRPLEIPIVRKSNPTGADEPVRKKSSLTFSDPAFLHVPGAREPFAAKGNRL